MRACNLPVPKHLITGEMVVNGKPDPEGFLLAARALSVRPERCVVFEDAEAGITAAFAGGFKVVVVGNKFTSKSPEIVGSVENFTQLTVSLITQRLSLVKNEAEQIGRGNE